MMGAIWKVRMDVNLFQIVFVSKIHALIIRIEFRMIRALRVKYEDRWDGSRLLTMNVFEDDGSCSLCISHQFTAQIFILKCC